MRLKNIAVFLLLLFVVAMLAACSEPTPIQELGPLAKECATPIPGQSRLVVFGDSQTMGQRSEIGGCVFSWAYVVAGDLNRNILNRAIGATSLTRASAQGPSQLDQVQTTQFEPTDTVIFMAGLNDAEFNGTNQTKAETFRDQLAQTLTAIKAQAAQVYVATPYQLPTRSPQATVLYEQMVSEAAATAGVPFIDLTQFTPQSDEFISDQVHFNPTGQRRLASFIESQL